MRYHIITYGCQMNKSDSERIALVLENCGYQKASKIEEADLIVVNMCSVRQSAVDRVYGKIKDFAKLKTKNEKLKIILTGCILKEDRKKFRQLFDLILDIKNLQKWQAYLLKKDKKEKNSSPLDYFSVLPKPKSSFCAYVPIMTGCNNFCTYCVVPYTRGPEISRPAEEIICEVKNLVKRGCREIWLLGQNVNSYQGKLKTKSEKRKTSPSQIFSKNLGGQATQNSKLINFAKLLKLVNEIEGDFWIRFTSSHPKPSTRAKLSAGLVPHRNEVSGAGDFSWDELIEVMAKCKKVTPYLNLPVQSGDNKILKKMNRPYTVEQYKNLVKKIRQKIPEISLSTDVIVGFPGETKKQFENTVKLFRQVKFDMAYIAQFSSRPGTAVFIMKDSVPQKEKQRREKVLTETLKQTALEKNKKYIGKTVEVLPEESKREYLIGKTRNYKTVKFKGTQNLIGTLIKVKITDVLPWGLKGKFYKNSI